MIYNSKMEYLFKTLKLSKYFVIKSSVFLTIDNNNVQWTLSINMFGAFLPQIFLIGLVC